VQEIKNDLKVFFDKFGSLSDILEKINYNLNISQFEITYNNLNNNSLTIKNNRLTLEIR
jgi:hypothetical protein